MKIVHFIKWLRLRDGGTVRAVLDMCAALAARGHHVIAMSTDDSGVPAHWKLPPSRGVPSNLCLDLKDPLFERRGRSIEHATRDTLTQFIPAKSMLRARQALADADVLHVHGAWANVNHQMISAARTLRIPYVVSPHGMLDDWSMAQGALKKRLHLALFSGRNLNRALAIHCTAAAEKQQVAPRLRPVRTLSKGAVVVPLLFDTAPMLNLPGPTIAHEHFPTTASSHPTILFLSRLHVKKGVELLLHAFAALSDHPLATLVVAGPADPPEYLQHLEELARRLGIAQRVQFVGMVTGLLKWSLYQAADLFVLPTSQENFGYVLLEALACGTPVVTTTGVDIWPELRDSGGAEIITGTGEPIIQNLTLAIDSLLKDAPRRAAMAQRGRAWALRFLNTDTIVDALEEMYTPISSSERHL